MHLSTVTCTEPGDLIGPLRKIYASKNILKLFRYAYPAYKRDKFVYMDWLCDNLLLKIDPVL